MQTKYLVRIAALFTLSGLAGLAHAGAGQPAEEFYTAIRNNDLGALRALISQHGSNPRDAKGSTPLHYAATVGSMDAIRILVAAGADINAKNAFDATPLVLGAADSERAQYLILKGADVHVRSKMGRTALYMAAARDGGSETVKLLLARGADPSVADSARRTPLYAAANANDTASAELLLAKGAEADAADYHGATPLMAAAGNGNLKLVRLLLAKGANVNATTQAEIGQAVKNGPVGHGYLTPLLMAATYGSPELLRTLLEAGANVNAKDVRGITSLVLAVATDHAQPKAIRMLLDHGADLKIKAKDGSDAIAWARKQNNPAVLKELGVPVVQPVTAAMLPTAAEALNFSADSQAGAIQKSIGLLQKSAGVAFQNGGCASCHSHNMPVAAMAMARKAGIPVNPIPEQEMTKGGVAAFGSFEQPLLQRMDMPAPEILSAALLQFEMEGVEGGRVTDAALLNLAAQQRKDGSWHIFLARPPYSDGDIARTALIIRAMKFYAPEGRKQEFAARIARAAAYLQSAKPVSMDDCNMRLLGLKWAGAKGSGVANGVDALLQMQRPDGGWAQTANLQSDAFATAQTLYTLRELDVEPANQRVQAGVRYLLRTQAPDGSWHVKSRALKFQPYFDGGFPYEHDQWISSTATSWAVMALSRCQTASHVSIASLR